MMKFILSRLTIVLGSFFAATLCHGSIIAQDSAADSTYDDGWDSTDNGGFGFFPWTLGSSVGTSGHFVFTSTENGNGDSNGDGDIDTANRAWGMFANSGTIAEAFRGFASTLSPGDTFRAEMDNGFIDSSGGSTDLMALRTFGGDNRMELLFIGGLGTYLVNDAVVGFDTGIPFTDEGLAIEILLTAADTYNLSITELGTGTNYQFLNRTFASSGEITNFRGVNANAGFGPEANAYFNSLSIERSDVVPEATALMTWSLIGATIGVAVWKRRDLSWAI